MPRSFVRRPSAALIISTISLLVALGGTSYAAFTLPRNSVGTKQLKNKAVTLAKIAPAAQSALATIGPRGPQGAQGAKGDPGPAGPLLRTLPSGQSETGVFAAQGSNSGPGFGYDSASISFWVPLSSAPAVHVILAGDASTADCPGTAAAPSAAPGQLCIFEGVEFNRTALNVYDPSFSSSEGTASRYGAMLSLQAASTGYFDSTGTWAVTAP